MCGQGGQGGCQRAELTPPSVLRTARKRQCQCQCGARWAVGRLGGWAVGAVGRCAPIEYMRISCAMAVRTERRGRSLRHAQTGQPVLARVAAIACAGVCRGLHCSPLAEIVAEVVVARVQVREERVLPSSEGNSGLRTGAPLRERCAGEAWAWAYSRWLTKLQVSWTQ